MKRILIAALVIMGTTTAFAQKKVSDVAKFDMETFDFGKIKQNVPAIATYTITNTSNEPIIIESATPACGCTMGDYTKAPIAPGKSGTVTATFNAAALGAIHKTVTLKLNGIEQPLTLNLAGEVLEETAYTTWVANKKKVTKKATKKITSKKTQVKASTSKS